MNIQKLILSVCWTASIMILAMIIFIPVSLWIGDYEINFMQLISELFIVFVLISTVGYFILLEDEKEEIDIIDHLIDE